MYEIKQAAVIGAGTMGLGIAGQLANAGIEVLLLDLAGEGENRNAVAGRALERLMDERQPGLLHAEAEGPVAEAFDLGQRAGQELLDQGGADIVAAAKALGRT